jgi:hypothetical protein
VQRKNAACGWQKTFQTHLECKFRLLKFCERTQKTNFGRLRLPRQCVNVYMRSWVFVKAKALNDVFEKTEQKPSLCETRRSLRFVFPSASKLSAESDVPH